MSTDLGSDYLGALTTSAHDHLSGAGWSDQQIVGILDALAPVLEHAAADRQVTP